MATDLQGFTTQEVLNKVLNTTSESFKVDIVSGAEYAEDSGHTTADTGSFVLGVRNDTLGTLGDASGDYVPFQMNASGALYVEVATLPSSTSTIEVVGDAAENAAAAGNPVLIGGRYDSSSRTLGDGDVGALALDADGAVHIADGGNAITIDGTVTANLGTTDNAVLDAIAASLAIVDDWDDSNYANVNLNVAGSDIAANAGTMSATTPRVTIATDDTHFGAVGAAADVDGVVHGQLRYIGAGVDTLETTLSNIETAIQIIDDWDDSNYANVNINIAGTDVDGNSGNKSAQSQRVVIATDDVNVSAIKTSVELIDDAVYADDADWTDGSSKHVLVGGLYGSNTITSGDVGPLALDPTGALYTREFLGQAGSILVTGTSNAVTTGVSGTKFVAIQFLEDTTFDAGSTGLVASTTGLWPDDGDASTTIDGDGGAVTGSEVFPQGMTIFGRWDGFKLDSGKVIGYLGYV